MQERIKAALAPLLGLALTGSWRPEVKGFEALQRFEFGPQRDFTNNKGERVTVGDYALHIGCPWRIIRRERIIVAYIDLYFPDENAVEAGGDDFDSYTPGASWRDRQMQRFVEQLYKAPLIVKTIEADAVGSVRLKMSGGYRLEILPMDSLSFEFWRLLSTGTESTQQEHFVVTGRGVQE